MEEVKRVCWMGGGGGGGICRSRAAHVIRRRRKGENEKSEKRIGACDTEMLSFLSAPSTDTPYLPPSLLSSRHLHCTLHLAIVDAHSLDGRHLIQKSLDLPWLNRLSAASSCSNTNRAGREPTPQPAPPLSQPSPHPTDIAQVDPVVPRRACHLVKMQR
jgi:hypothetical protein